MLTTLDLFLLTLIQEGISTPYGWQSRASVSLGASLPAMRRLVSAGMVEEADKENRRRREFRITSSGRNELKRIDHYLQQALDEEPGDIESILRITSIALHKGKAEKAKVLVLQSAEEFSKKARRAKRQARTLPIVHSVAGLYVATMSVCEASRQEATSKSLASLVTLFIEEFGSKSLVTKPRQRPR